MKKAIIIGATTGIGKALANILIAKNYKVGITGRRTNLLVELKNENPKNFAIQAFDITDINNISKHLEKLVDKLGGLDLLIISSGIGNINDNLDFELEKQTIDTNILGFTAIADWAFNYFDNQKFGHLVAISSIGGLRGNWQAPAYNASKAFQINYLEALRQKSKKLKTKIIISDIRPGFVDTNMAKGEGLFWVSSVNKAAKQIFRAIKNKRKIVYITKRWRLIAILLKSLPRQIYDLM
ncbi:MAG: SDR family NAD(P)-dependent oxidoreductase [Bacteroidetes bacterium]|jgi:short-subunit dehydrogenase|nr:SDR family NAD(P)-dependent oxidoreductase [Bacteroidota bacterium]MBT6686478.1 SDR family NAD(P)-dependent oxidoreductase [Bacteroidota bacterium]MBT7142707.1 SDR family NAD(P)-dependent oxidoreductase [Bacteroidota bacterium]MBT7491159.1 SDR family NAD(P)-dependent oxidoreductase [Bacteroidota bacterium]